MCKHCSVNSYADDTVYISVFKRYPLLFYIIQDLQCFFEWLDGKSLVLNVFKTKRSKFSPSSSDGGVGNREKLVVVIVLEGNNTDVVVVVVDGNNKNVALVVMVVGGINRNVVVVVVVEQGSNRNVFIALAVEEETTDVHFMAVVSW